MRIINLVENTEGNAGCGVEHGLSIYIETAKHKLLMDTGASGLLLENARKKGVDLTRVDTVVLSHGHFDHGGGIPAFAQLNPEARIYMQESAEEGHFSTRGELHYIGLPEEVRDLPQVVRVNGDLRIDQELSLFSRIPVPEPVPASNDDLMRKEGEAYVPDDFRHEQCLVIRQEGISILLSGCAHHGILNILRHYRTLYGTDPDYVISGFHLMRRDGYSPEDIRTIVHTAMELRRYRTVFYTGHCTGEKPFRIMKRLMGRQLRYMHCGDELQIPDAGQGKGKRGSYMKWHRFFAWATVVCFVMTMITGYRRK